MRSLTLGQVLRGALATYRDRFWVVAGTAVVVFGPAAAATTAATLWAEERVRGDGAATLLWGALVLAALLVASLGLTFYAGLLDRVVGAHRFGHEHHPLGRVLRTLPYGRLIGADLALAGLVSLVSVLVLPGLVVFTLLALTGPVITIENRGVLGAFRRSAALIRRRFWLTATAVTLPVLIEHAVVHEVAHLLEGASPAAAFAVAALLGASLLALVALIEVTLAHELIARQRASSD